MLKHIVLIGLCLIAPLTSALAELPYLEDYKHTPKFANVFYGSPTNKYKLMIQFFGADTNNLQGRFCELDDNGKPFNCISVKPDEHNRQCTLSTYRESPLPVSDMTISEADRNEMFFLNDVAKRSDQELATAALNKVKLNNVGSARATGVPASMPIAYINDLQSVKDEWLKNQGTPTVDAIYFAKLACHLYFEPGGIAQRFEMHRTKVETAVANKASSAVGASATRAAK